MFHIRRRDASGAGILLIGNRDTVGMHVVMDGNMRGREMARYKDPNEMLAAIAYDETIQQFSICILRKDGSFDFAHFQMTRANLAYASLFCAQTALEKPGTDEPCDGEYTTH